MKGSVIKRGGKWSVVFDLGRDPVSGKRLRDWHSGYESEDAAEQARVELLRSQYHGAYVGPSRLTLAEYLTAQWLPAVQASLTPSTFESYSRNVRVHLVPRLGQIPMQKLSAQALTVAYGEMLRSGRKSRKHEGEALSPRSVRYAHTILRKALADAVRWGVIVRNPADAATPPSAKSARPPIPKTWTATELRTFLAHVRDDRLYALWVFYATTGLRRGEAIGVRWASLDLDAGRVGIVESSVSVAYKVAVGKPKSARGQRAIDLDPMTVAALREHRKRQVEDRLKVGSAYQDNGLVFCREDGSPLHPESVSDAFEKLVRSAAVSRLTLHGLRHTWATLALASGVSPKVVSERLGHASVSFTLDTYSHVLPGLQAEAAKVVAGLVLGEVGSA